MRNKVIESFDEAVADIPDGATVMMHSFVGPGGVSQNLIRALRDKGSKGLTVISCAYGIGGMAGKPFADIITPGDLVGNKQVRKVVTTWVMTRKAYALPTPLAAAVKAGEVEVELVGQGTLAQRMRAGGSGMGAFYSPVGIGTVLEEGKEKRVINGREYLLEYPLRGDFGFVRARKADRMGNLVYRGPARSYNPLIAMACDVVIAEVDEIVEVGELDPDIIVTPGILVDRIVRVKESDHGSATDRRAGIERLFRGTGGGQ